METVKFLVLSVLLSCSCFSSVYSQQVQQQPAISPLSQQNVLPVNHQQQNLGNIPSSQDPLLGTQLEAVEPASTNHYPYQSSQLSPSTYHQPYSGSNNYGRDVYSGNRDQGWGWYPYFGVNAGTAWELSAYFGPIFWGMVAILATFGACVGLSRFVMGSDIFGGLYQRIKDSAPSARALNLDNLTNIVYQALDTYGKLAAKDARQGNSPSLKG